MDEFIAVVPWPYAGQLKVLRVVLALRQLIVTLGTANNSMRGFFLLGIEGKSGFSCSTDQGHMCPLIYSYLLLRIFQMNPLAI